MSPGRFDWLKTPIFFFTKPRRAAFAANEVVSGESYNCIYRKDGHGLKHCLSPLFGDYRLLDTSDAVSAGDAQYLESLIDLPAEIARTDFYGNDLTGLTGAIAAGASQTVVAPPYGGLSFSEKTPKLNGVTIPSGGYVYATEWPVRWEIVIPGKDVLYYEVTAAGANLVRILPTLDGKAYFVPSPHPGELASAWPCVAAEVLWTDPELGNDETGDGSEGNPYKTLQHAMDVSKSVAAQGYTLVKAKKGRYAEGGKANADDDVFARLAMDNSSSWPAKVVAVDGPDETFLVGSTDGETDTRCFQAKSSASFLQGFTLTDGRLQGKEGAVILAGTLTDCVVSNCTSAKNLCSTQVLAYRTRFLDNTLGASLYAGSSSWAFCAFSGNVVTAGDLISGAGNPALYNCTFIGNTVSSTASILGATNVEPNNTIVDANGCRFAPCWASGMGTDMLWNFTRVEADPRIGDDFRPSVLSPALGVGDLNLEVWYMKSASYYMQADLYGKPVAMLPDGRTHLGAVQEGFLAEYDLDAADGGVTVTGGEVGCHFVNPDQPVTLTIAPAAGGARLPLGVVVVDIAGSFSTNLFADLPGGTWTATIAGPETSVKVSVLYSSDWYVDIENGDDANDGFTAESAKKTLVGATTNAALRAGDVIRVAPGTYETETAKSKDDSLVFCRVVIPEGVTVASTGGKDVTIIRGAKAPASEGGDGCGEGAVRCAYLKKSAKLIGFTLTGGRARWTWTQERPEDSAGGGVCAANKSAEVIDCIFTDCKAETAAGSSATFIRCRFDNCGTVVGSDASFILSNSVLHNCLVNKTGGAFGLRGCTVYNSTVLPTPGWHCTWSDASTAYDSILLGFVNGSTKCTGCVIATGDGYSTWGGSVTPTSANVTDCVFTNVSALGLSSTDWKPTSSDSLVVDAARAEARATAEGALDLVGVPRVLNGALDIGAYEWDWRPTYAQSLGRFVTVDDVSPDVVETEDGKVRLDGDGTRLALTLSSRNAEARDYVIPYSVSGSAVLNATVNGQPLPAASGSGELTFTCAGNVKLVLSLEGDGAADIGRFTRSGGTVLILR